MVLYVDVYKIYVNKETYIVMLHNDQISMVDILLSLVLFSIDATGKYGNSNNI